ncbi:MAG: TonB-dependent receptor [Sphingomonas bacterium]|nr:TonB-dependent receptor [Sphingomonas bacterium]
MLEGDSVAQTPHFAQNQSRIEQVLVRAMSLRIASPVKAQDGHKIIQLGGAIMRNMSSILWTGTAMALALAATPASAQTAPAQDPATVAEVPAAPIEEADEEPAAEGDAIVVTGIRRSLESAKNLKRRSDQIIDAIVAEDIGKLPDIAVSETAARIPGVQVTRRAGEADSVLVRGLPDFATTYNGREIFTAQTRVVALQDFPSANIAAIEVFKSSTADLVEAGLAGLVNVRSRKPFDFKGFEFAGSVWGLYSKQAGKWNPNLNLLVTNRWDLGDGGQFGALLNISYTELDYLDSEVSNTDFIAGGPSGSRFPDIQRIFYNSGNRVRPSVNAALQYRPTPDIEIYAEGLWQGFRNKISSRGWNQPLWGGSQYTNLDFREGTDLLSGGSVTDPFRADGFQGGTYNKTDTYQFAVGGSWDAGPLRLTADLARTTSKFTGSTSSVDYRVVRGYTVNFDNETPEFSFDGFDPSNPANYLFQGYYEEEQVSKGDDWQFRMDADYDTGVDFLPKLEAGFRFSDRDAHREFGNRFAQFDNQSIPISSVPLNYELFRSGFRGTDVQNGFTNWLAPTYGDIRRSRTDLRAFVIGLPPGNFGFVNDICCTANYTLDDVTSSPTQVFDASEKSTAGYIQAHYKFGDVVDGVIGLRAVRTKSGVAGTSRLETSPGVFTFVPVDGSNSYTDWLPNASARIKITPEVQLRLSATQTRTRPTFEQLNPSFNLGPPRIGCNPGNDPFACARFGGGGNPGLTPFLSNNYDASLEYFFSPSGFVAAAVFRRDLTGFIQNDQDRVTDPVLGPIIINRPFNTNKGRIDGAEVQLSTFFDFDFLPMWARRFGTQANVTYLKTDVVDPDPVIDNRRIYGVSKWTWNIAGFYENGPFSARLSYNKRSKTLETIQNRGNDLYIETGTPAGRLDFSTSYNVRQNFTLFFDWTNILEKPYRQDFSSARDGAPRSDYVRFLRFEETIFSGGLRFRFQ